MARASRPYSLSICSSAMGHGRRKPRGSRSPSRYPQLRKELKMVSRSELFFWVSTTAAPPLEDLDFGLGIRSVTRIKDARRGAVDSGGGKSGSGSVPGGWANLRRPEGYS